MISNNMNRNKPFRIGGEMCAPKSMTIRSHVTIWKVTEMFGNFQRCFGNRFAVKHLMEHVGDLLANSYTFVLRLFFVEQ